MARAEPRYAARTRYWPAGRRRNSLRKCPRCMATRAPRTWTHPRACSVLQPYANAAGQCAAHNAADEHGARQAALGLRPATLDVHRRGRHGMGSGLHDGLRLRRLRAGTRSAGHDHGPLAATQCRRGARGAGRAGGAGREINRAGAAARLVHQHEAVLEVAPQQARARVARALRSPEPDVVALPPVVGRAARPTPEPVGAIRYEQVGREAILARAVAARR